MPLETVLVGPPAAPAEPPRPRIWPVLVAMPLYISGMMAAGILLGLIAFLVQSQGGGAGGIVGDDLDAFITSPPVWLGLALVQCAAGVGIALLGAKLSPEPLRRRLALGPGKLSVPSLLVASLGLVAAGSILQELLALLGVPITGAFEQFSRVVGALSPGMLLPAVLVIGVLVPIGEELFFRGYVQSRLCRRWGTWPGILAAALFFGLAHFDWIQSPSAVVAGLYLGWLAQRTGSVVPAVVAHAVNNTIAVVITWAFPDAAPAPATHAALLAVWIGATSGALAWLAPRLRRAREARSAAEPPSTNENAAPLDGSGGV